VAQERSVYSVIPRDLAAERVEPLRRALRDEPGVEVIVERRVRERRAGRERRQCESAPPREPERRRIRAETGRRVAERRAQLIPAMPPEGLRHLGAISFVERVEPSTIDREDAATAELVMRIQAGESELIGRLYERYFDRVYSYLHLTIEDCHEVEDATQDVFMRVIDALPRYERRAAPFRAWLFRIARNCAINRVSKRRRSSVESPEEVARRAETAGEVAVLASTEWFDDRELLELVKQLPPAQREVIALRYLLEFRSDEIAEALGRNPDAVRQLHQRAMRFLRHRLKECEGGPEATGLQPAAEGTSRASG